MKNFNKYYLVVFGLSIFPIVSIFFTSEMPHVHDGIVHLARMGAYFKALGDFQIPVRWAGDLNYGYGMPIFNFIYHVPYLISSLFLYLGFGLVNTFKIVLALSFLLSGVFMFAFAKEFFEDDKKALLAAVFYQFAPFRLVELMVRGSFGEVYAYTFFPLVLFGLVKIFNKKNIFWVIFTAIAVSLLVLSHNALSLTFFGISVLFILFFGRTKELIAWGGISLILGLMMSAFYWIPAIFEHKFTYGDLFMKDLFRTHFPPIQNFFIPNFTNNELLQTGGIATQIGLFHTVAIILSYKISKKIFVFSFLILGVAFFLMHPISTFVWEKVSFLRQFQFSWRFLGVVVFATSFLSVSLLSFKILQKKWVLATFILFVVASTFYYWKPPLGFKTIDENYYWNYPLNTTYFGETDVIWSGGAATSYPKQRVEVIGGEAIIENFQKKSNIHTFKVEAQSNAQLVDHTQYFPGWRAVVDRKEVKIEFQDPNNRGEITFWVPKGRHDVEVVFGESPIRQIVDIVSLLTLLGVVGAFFILRRRIAK